MPLRYARNVLSSMSALRKCQVLNNVRHYRSPRDDISYGTPKVPLDLDNPEWKTGQSVINTDPEFLMVTGFNNQGFVLNTGNRVLGSVAMFPKTLLHWNVYSAKDITEESLSLFVNLQPSLDMLVIGVGDEGQQLDLKVINYLKKNKIGVEFTVTYRAVALYNFLVNDGRYVAGAFLPGEEVPKLQQLRISTQNVDDAHMIARQIDKELEDMQIRSKDLATQKLIQGRLIKEKKDLDLEERKSLMEERKQTLRDRKKQHQDDKTSGNDKNS